MPVDERNQMIKITRLSSTLFSTMHVSYVHFAPLQETSFHEDELQTEQQNSISDSSPGAYLGIMQNIDPSTITVFKRPVPKAQRNKVILPMLLWAPERFRHAQFPPEFRRIVQMILMAANRWLPPTFNGGNNQKYKSSCSALPVVVWFVIFSYANR